CGVCSAIGRCRKESLSPQRHASNPSDGCLSDDTTIGHGTDDLREKGPGNLRVIRERFLIIGCQSPQPLAGQSLQLSVTWPRWPTDCLPSSCQSCWRVAGI